MRKLSLGAVVISAALALAACGPQANEVAAEAADSDFADYGDLGVEHQQAARQASVAEIAAVQAQRARWQSMPEDQANEEFDDYFDKLKAEGH